MESKTIFDVATKPFEWEPIWASLYLSLFGCLLICLKKLKWRHAVSGKWGYFFILVAIINAGYDTTRWYLSRRDHVGALRSGHYEVVQGTVDNFHPMPDDGSSNESFTILGRSFSYSDDFKFKTTTCFNHTTAHGGPIQPGMSLRVKFIDQCILQIEALSESSTAGHK